MPSIAFIDAETSPGTGDILDLGAILEDGANFHKNSLPGFLKFIEKADFICGHNIIEHDLKHIGESKLKGKFFIDTLFWSPLLFPKELNHSLSKDDKLLKCELNNPLSDAIKGKAFPSLQPPPAHHRRQRAFSATPSSPDKAALHYIFPQLRKSSTISSSLFQKRHF